MKRFTFWLESESVDEELVGQVMTGAKTATARPVTSWGVPAHEFDSAKFAAGDLVEFYDLGWRLRGHLRMTEIYRCSFGDIPERLWRGEACGDAEDFRAAHRRGWPHVALADDTALMALHFELVSRED